MLQSSKDVFSESGQDHLRGLIRVTIQSSELLKAFREKKLSQDDLQYGVRTILSGMDSFYMVSSTYKILSDSTDSEINFDNLPTFLLDAQFFPMYEKFITENDFSKKCRLLLDLFKLQVIFATALFE